MPVGCAKSILISFNLILWLAGGTLLVLGTWVFVDPSKIHLFHVVTSETLVWDFGFYLAYALLSLGGIIFLVGLFGCCGAVRENRCLLVTYFVLLFLLMCIELGIAVITVIYKERFLDGLEDRIANHVIQHYGHKNSNEKYIKFSDAVDFAQYKFNCCGIRSDDDYIMSRWRNESQQSPERRSVPFTCCVLLEPGGAQVPNAGSPISVVTRVFHGTVEEAWQNPRVKDDVACQDTREEIHKYARYKEGCLSKIETWFKRESTILITVGISTAALQVFGMIFSTCLCRNLGDSI